MKEQEQSPETDPSSKLASEIAEAINGLMGSHEWSGNNPFEIKMASEKERKAYIYRIRRGDDWITIEEVVSDNPSLDRTFNLDKKGEVWTYTDPHLIKYGESSLGELQTVFDRLKIAIEATAPKRLDGPTKKLPPAETE